MRIENSRGAPTHSARLERWLGADETARLSAAMRGFYWPVPVQGVPGRVFAMPGGDFAGEIRAGVECSAVDRALDIARRARRERFFLAGRSRRQQGAYASLGALITALTTAGKRQDFFFNKVGVAANAIGNSNDLWSVGNNPAAGAAGAAAPGGTAFDRTAVGALPFNNPGNANTSHFLGGYPNPSVGPNTLLLYDRLFGVAKTMNSATIEGVTGVPTRYQNATATAADYIGGNFCFPSVPTTVLAATAHNWVAGDPVSPNQGCTYINQAGVEKGFLVGTGVSACVKNGIDLSVQNWFLGLASGDVGCRELQTMQCSAAVATGTIDFVIGHAIAWLPSIIANYVAIIDSLYTAANLAFVFDNACLAFLEITKPAVTATTYSGQITLVSE